MALVGFLLVGREGGDAGGVGNFDDGVEVKSDGIVALVAEVGEVEGNTGGPPLNASHQLADLHLKFDGIDKYYIVRIGMTDANVRVKIKLHMQAIDIAIGKPHRGHRTSREQQARIVDTYHALLISEAPLVEAGELVVLDVPMTMSLLGEASLDGGAEEGGGMLHGLEKGTLPQLPFRLFVGERFGLAAAELLAEAGVIDTVADGARLFYNGWFDFGHISECIILYL